MNQDAHKISSVNLAALIADALITGGLMDQEMLDAAIEIIVEEINVRKALGDY